MLTWAEVGKKFNCMATSNGEYDDETSRKNEKALINVEMLLMVWDSLIVGSMEWENLIN